MSCIRVCQGFSAVLSLFVVHDNFFFFFDTSDWRFGRLELSVQINMHTLWTNLYITSYLLASLLRRPRKISFSFFKSIGCLVQHLLTCNLVGRIGWVWTKSKEVSENVTSLLFLGLSSWGELAITWWARRDLGSQLDAICIHPNWRPFWFHSRWWWSFSFDFWWVT